MRSREAAIRTKRFGAQEKARKVKGLEQMIREFESMEADLERQVQAEEDRTGVKDRGHFAYSTFAKAANQRREKLKESIDDLRVQLDAAVKERDEAMEELAADEPLEQRQLIRSRRRGDRQTLALRSA